jgi:hypothetical protein
MKVCQHIWTLSHRREIPPRRLHTDDPPFSPGEVTRQASSISSWGGSITVPHLLIRSVDGWLGHLAYR